VRFSTTLTRGWTRFATARIAWWRRTNDLADIPLLEVQPGKSFGLGAALRNALTIGPQLTEARDVAIDSLMASGIAMETMR
jgi:hypothetical protein